jgi:hypothetical protein
MEFTADVSNNGSGATSSDMESLDLGVLPDALAAQCQGLIASYHEIHGYACLPNMLWRAQLGDFIKKHPHLRQILRKASTTRSAKVSNKGFVEIATVILSLEILASDFASWSTMFPEAKSMANALLRMRGPRMSLMEYYLYPPKHISPAVMAALTPPPSRKLAEQEWHAASGPELSGQKRALDYATAVREDLQGRSTYTAPAA